VRTRRTTSLEKPSLRCSLRSSRPPCLCLCLEMPRGRPRLGAMRELPACKCPRKNTRPKRYQYTLKIMTVGVISSHKIYSSSYSIIRFVCQSPTHRLRVSRSAIPPAPHLKHPEKIGLWRPRNMQITVNSRFFAALVTLMLNYPCICMHIHKHMYLS
jgi:hypothetical protein